VGDKRQRDRQITERQQDSHVAGIVRRSQHGVNGRELLPALDGVRSARHPSCRPEPCPTLVDLAGAISLRGPHFFVETPMTRYVIAMVALVVAAAPLSRVSFGADDEATKPL